MTRSASDRCDFCEAQGYIPWTYRMPPSQEYGTDWGACDACKELIERDDRQGILQRALGPFAGLPREHRTFIITRMADLHNVFWEHRLPIPPDNDYAAIDGDTQRSTHGS